MKKHPPRVNIHEPKYQRKTVILAVILLLMLSYGAFLYIPDGPGYMAVQDKEINEKAKPHLRQSCLEEEKKEEVDLDCDNVTLLGDYEGHEDPPMWTEWEGIDSKRTEFAWTVGGSTTDAGNNFQLMIDVRLDRDGNLLRYIPYYRDYGVEIKGRPKDYVSPSSPPLEALSPVIPD